MVVATLYPVRCSTLSSFVFVVVVHVVVPSLFHLRTTLYTLPYNNLLLGRLRFPSRPCALIIIIITASAWYCWTGWAHSMNTTRRHALVCERHFVLNVTDAIRPRRHVTHQAKPAKYQADSCGVVVKEYNFSVVKIHQERSSFQHIGGFANGIHNCFSRR